MPSEQLNLYDTRAADDINSLAALREDVILFCVPGVLNCSVCLSL